MTPQDRKTHLTFNLHNLIQSGDEDNIDLAFTLAESLNINLLEQLREQYYHQINICMYGEFSKDKIEKEQIKDLFKYSKVQTSCENLEKYFKEGLQPIPNVTHIEITGNSRGNSFEIEVNKVPPIYQIFPNLEILKVTDGNYKEFPQDLSEYKNLTDLSYNNCTAHYGHLNHDSIKNAKFPPNLELLGLNYCELKEIPSQIFNLSQLKQLYMYSNQIEEIPKEINKLTNLSHLDLTENMITKIPKELYSLDNISVIELHYNDLHEIPNYEFPSQKDRTMYVSEEGGRSYDNRPKTYDVAILE